MRLSRDAVRAYPDGKTAPQFFRLEGRLVRSAREAERAAAQSTGERESDGA